MNGASTEVHGPTEATETFVSDCATSDRAVETERAHVKQT